jgi:biopolymer transport protein ExbD
VPAADLQITAFMNLMVALVPFLLITAVFSQLTVLELNLPEPSQSASDQPPPRVLSVIVRSAGLTVTDSGGPIRELPRTDSGLDTAGLSELLTEVKARVPDENKITLLLEPQVSYDDLVRVMDAVRVSPDGEDDLFPQISIGDAPAREGG